MNLYAVYEAVDQSVLRFSVSTTWLNACDVQEAPGGSSSHQTAQSSCGHVTQHARVL